jgi:hypothetical protein
LGECGGWVSAAALVVHVERRVAVEEPERRDDARSWTCENERSRSILRLISCAVSGVERVGDRRLNSTTDLLARVSRDPAQ